MICAKAAETKVSRRLNADRMRPTSLLKSDWQFSGARALLVAAGGQEGCSPVLRFTAANAGVGNRSFSHTAWGGHFVVHMDCEQRRGSEPVLAGAWDYSQSPSKYPDEPACNWVFTRQNWGSKRSFVPQTQSFIPHGQRSQIPTTRLHGFGPRRPRLSRGTPQAARSPSSH